MADTILTIRNDSPDKDLILEFKINDKIKITSIIATGDTDKEITIDITEQEEALK